MEVVDTIKDFGFPIVAAVGMLYMIYFVWKTITEEVEKNLEEANVTLIALIDRIRMLDNDIIRLQQKLDTAIEMRRKQNEKEEN
ncbi:MAG: hypothetical protein CMA07_05840 [Euryarchaeota archaeon]|jgi:hypothetical protein|nr:hypothetical protein [Euryarchaeota archaeon]|tara:strand:+ start:2970 stop:3221 length:252 start_codon:yes stop_codon:yes gene_type:complete